MAAFFFCRIKLMGGFSCLQEKKKRLDTACHIDSIMHGLPRSHFFPLLISSTCCKDLMSVKLAVCHTRVIRGGKKSNFLIIRLNFNGEKKMESWVTL